MHHSYSQFRKNTCKKEAARMSNSIDRFIIRKLNHCEEEHTKEQLLELLMIRIEMAERKEELMSRGKSIFCI